MGFHAKAQTASKPKTTKSNGKTELNVEGLREYAALANAKKQIEAALETLKTEVNEAAMEVFLNSQRKDSLNGVDGDTTASLQLRKRTSRSVLSEQEEKVLRELGIDIDKSADSKVYVNPSYADNDEMAEKVFAALDGIVPDDFLLSTGEKFIAGPKAVDQALAIEDEDQRAAVVNMVTTQAARCKFGGSNEEALEIISKLL